MGSVPGLGRVPWGREWQPTPVFLPGESHGQRGLVGYRPQGCKESDTTERLNFNFSPAVPLAASYFINQESSLPRDFALCLEHSSLRCCVANSLTSSRTFLKYLITEAYSTTLLKMMISLSSLVNFITFLCFVFLHSTYSLLILYVIDLIIYCLSPSTGM